MRTRATYGPARPRRYPWGLLHGLRLAALPLGLALLATLPARAATLHVVALGDSLTAGLGLPAERSFPARLQAALQARGLDVAIVNAGVSGDTAQGGLGRVDWSVPDGTDAVLVELGANDALQGLDPAGTRTALAGILDRLKARGIPAMLLGMMAPPNMGPSYVSAFDAIYPDLAKRYGVSLYPFYLDGVAAQAALNQADGMHPNARGVDVIVGRITPSVEAFLKGVGSR